MLQKGRVVPCLFALCSVHEIRRMAHRWVYPMALAASLFVAAYHACAQTPSITLSAGIYLIRAEVANDFESRGRGLMFRESLGPNQGMLFVFEGPDRQCMWMKNTLIPLSVAFIDADGTIANIANMRPRDETPHCAVQPVPYALEMERNWFAARGLKAGTRIGGLEKAPPPR